MIHPRQRHARRSTPGWPWPPAPQLQPPALAPIPAPQSLYHLPMTKSLTRRLGYFGGAVVAARPVFAAISGAGSHRGCRQVSSPACAGACLRCASSLRIPVRRAAGWRASMEAAAAGRRRGSGSGIGRHVLGATACSSVGRRRRVSAAWRRPLSDRDERGLSLSERLHDSRQTRPAKRPVMVWIHGGAWTSGARRRSTGGGRSRRERRRRHRH